MFNGDSLLLLIYRKTCSVVPIYCMREYQVCYFGNSEKADMERLDKVVRTAAKIVGAETATPSTIYGSVAVKRLHRILSDAHHLLNQVLSSQVSRRASSQRLRCFRSRTSRFRDSFLPTAVRLHNSSL